MTRCIQIILITITIITLFTSCSITKMLNDGEYLYDGVDSIKIVNNIENEYNEYESQIIEKIKNTLNYETNGLDIKIWKLRFKLPSFRTWLYIKGTQDSTTFHRILRKFGTPPILISNVNPALRSKVAQTILNENGFLAAKVESMESYNKNDSLKISVSYSINPQKLYKYDSIISFPFINNSNQVNLVNVNNFAFIKKNSLFSIDSLEKERKNISDSLRNMGFYYFRPDMIKYKADTTITSGSITLKKDFIDGISPLALKAWTIRKVNIRLMDNNNYDTSSDLLLFDTISLDNNIKLFFNTDPYVRKEVLNKRIVIRPNNLYSQKNEEATLRAISNLGAFSSSEFIFSQKQKDIDSISQLDLDIILRPDKTWDLSLESLFKFKSTNFIGPGINLTISKRNIFGGGEALSTSVYGSYEWQKGKSPISSDAIRIYSYQLGSDISLVFPSILFPGKLNDFYKYSTSTSLKLSASILNRPSLYNLQSFGLSMIYDFQPEEGIQHHIQPIGLTFSLLSNSSERFNNLIKNNPSLGLSYRDQFIPQMGYSFIYDNLLGRHSIHHLWMRYSVSEAGNIINGIMSLSGKKYNDQKKLFKVPFAQFIKGTAEIRYTYKIDFNQSLASRFATGAIFSFGNSTISPFMEEFYVGGANSIRAFTVRSVGPGKFSPNNGPYSFMDQVGDFKLEGNIEYRARLKGRLQVALFLDAGNVWLIRKERKRIGASLTELTNTKDFINQIAIGTGAGIRYDLDYIVVRFDVGIGLHIPYDTGIHHWYNIPKFKDSLGFHLAVGYPF